MLLFRSEENVNHWCMERGISRKPILNIEQLWQLATAWYSNRLSRDARRPGPEEIQQIFSGLGLQGAFWELQS